MAYRDNESAYSKKLKNPLWQKKRLEILSRDEWTCQICLETEEMLVVHHRVYIKGREPWEYANNLLVTLCQSCHEGEHDEEAGASKGLLDSIKASGIFPSDFYRIADGFLNCPLGYPSEVRASILEFILSDEALMKAGEEAFHQSIKDKLKGAN